jgi:peptidoglycan/LPS O-acetylase OafA/YrhL
MIRLSNLDYLRGLAALGIMIYHYVTWTYGNFDSGSFLERVGTYGVSLFYVLSGLTLFHVYSDKISFAKKDLLGFARKRFFRIFPLLWLVTITAIVLSKQFPDPFKLFLNLSGLFGFVQWDAYFSPGVWSIGNELVFYFFFPFFIVLSRKNIPAMILLSLAVFSIYVYFGFFRLDPKARLSEQWVVYINPLNQLFLFLGGIIIGLVSRKTGKNNSISLIIICISLLLVILYPAAGDAIALVSGWNRLIFTLACFMICFGFFKLELKLPSFLHFPLSFLGEASYSVYLLHPIVLSVTSIFFKILERQGFNAGSMWKLIFSALMTLGSSAVVYLYFEKYFMGLGKKERKTL